MHSASVPPGIRGGNGLLVRPYSAHSRVSGNPDHLHGSRIPSLCVARRRGDERIIWQCCGLAARARHEAPVDEALPAVIDHLAPLRAFHHVDLATLGHDDEDGGAVLRAGAQIDVGGDGGAARLRGGFSNSSRRSPVRRWRARPPTARYAAFIDAKPWPVAPCPLAA
jgi:hypothetical protein